MANENGGRKSKLLVQVGDACRARQYSRRTEEAYVGWIKRFILHHGKRHPLELGADEVTAFLSHLATHHKVSASTQNQAASSLLFVRIGAATARGAAAAHEGCVDPAW